MLFHSVVQQGGRIHLELKHLSISDPIMTDSPLLLPMLTQGATGISWDFGDDSSVVTGDSVSIPMQP